MLCDDVHDCLCEKGREKLTSIHFSSYGTTLSNSIHDDESKYETLNMSMNTYKKG